jgi:two-component system, OmpR family, sensor histidine kinase KdpD
MVQTITNNAEITTASTAGAPPEALAGKQSVKAPPRNYFVALLACAITTAIATPLREHFDLANIVMVFLLTVVLVGVRLGRGPSVMASFVSVALFDFFFVPPRFTFSVDDPQYLLTFAVMLVVALIIGQLTAELKRQATDARAKEQRSHALYEMARELTGALTMAQVTDITQRSLRAAIDVEAVFLLPDETGQLKLVAIDSGDRLRNFAPLMAKLAYENSACTDLDAPYPVGYFPLKAPTQVRGVLAVVSPTQSAKPLYEHHEFLETVASLIAIAVERLHYAESAKHAQS